MTHPGAPTAPLELERAKQLFEFLREFSKRNLPHRRQLADQLWTLRLAELPRHPSIQVGEVQLAPTGGQAVAATAEPAVDDAPLLRVRRPNTTKAPPPPIQLFEWVHGTWHEPTGVIEVAKTRNRELNGETITESFEASPARVSALEEWKVRWGRWAEAERPVREALQVFSRLFELRGKIELDSERVELMLGDGRLRWRSGEVSIDHPVLLQRVELEFDPNLPEIRIIDADRPPELYGQLLQAGQGINPPALHQIRQELESGGFHPLMGEATSGFLRRIVQLLGSNGRFVAAPENLAPQADPVITRDPVLLLRARVSGFPEAFDRIVQDLEKAPELPVSLTRLVGVTPPPHPTPEVARRSPWGEPPDVLLSKPSNPEQVEIARALERHRAVLVQGPPGTGKSHTIANLIGHLVAHGKRVLVTSHTTKALRVLRSHLVETLQPLCVAVLENDLNTRAQMEQSVRTILSRLTLADEGTLEHEVASFAVERGELNDEINRITSDLVTAREAEYKPILIAGESIDPSEAARWVRGNTEGNEWISGRLEPGAPLPLADAELVALYATNGQITREEEHEIGEGLPPLGALPTPDLFQGLVAALGAEEQPELTRLWADRPLSSALPMLEELTGLVNQMVQELSAFTAWQRTVVAAGYAGAVERDLWLELGTQVDELNGRWEKARPLMVEFAPQVDPSMPLDEALRASEEVIRHLEGGGALGALALLFRGKWKRLIRASRVNAEPPTMVKQFRALRAHLSLEAGRRKLRQRWSRQAEPAGLSSFVDCGPTPEPALREYASQFPRLLSWWPERWERIEVALHRAGFAWQEFRQAEVARAAPAAPFDQDVAILSGPLQHTVGVRHQMALRQASSERLAAAVELLEPFRGPLCRGLLASVQIRDAAAYSDARNSVLDLAAKQAVWTQRESLLGTLSRVAPAWAGAVAERTGVHGNPTMPGDSRKAWRWRQLRQEIDRRAELDEVQLTTRLHQRRAELRRATAELIDRRAWLGQLRRTDLPARQALQGWADTQRRIGRGTGKRVPQLQARARELLLKARDAVPVWIMPLAQVAESFDPRSRRFDVVIIDEASQADVTGLLCWYLGDRVAVVGDHEQVSPLAVGQELGPIEALINEHLTDIPNSHLYDGKTSIYDLGRQSFGATIALREHFRCVPDIIEFSNHLSYNGEITALRNPSSAQRPHLVEHVVSGLAGAERDGKRNLAEARVVAALVAAVCGEPEYAGKSVGAISLLGDEQAGLILDLTVSLVGAEELDRRRFVAGNAAQFQGDERDVIFLSMVDVPTGNRLRMRQDQTFKQRYNVAASRAKDQLWLIHSLDADRDLQAGDLRRALIQHVKDPSSRRREVERVQQRAESPFESAVAERLINAGFRVQPQVWVGQYRIDMVVSDGTHQVALECDGDRFHGIDQIPQDMTRQAILERVGWQFIRVRGTRFYRDPEGTSQWLFDELERLGVKSIGTAPTEMSRPAAETSFQERVVRQAYEVMRERGWLPAQAEMEREAT